MKTTFTLVVLWSLFTSLNAFASPQLSSLPTAQATIFLDFDGHYVTSTIWNGGKAIDCAPSGMNDAQIIEIFNRVAEDYRPFNVNITTDSTKFLAAPLTKRIRMIVTTTSAWYTGVGGVAYVGSFTWGDDTPGFIFPDRLGPFKPKIVAECCSHESGHTLGLSHQSKYDGSCAMTSIYNDGVGTGAIGWAPIMGNSYYKNLTGWNNGPTPNGCAALQDNLTIITTSNGFSYRDDDYSNDAGINSAPIALVNKSFSIGGIISTTTDKDVFQIDLPQNGTLHLNALPFSVGANDNGSNLDVKVTLLNAQKKAINVYDDTALLNVIIDTNLMSGRYYIMLDGTGNTFASDYGSLGSYTVTGSFAPLDVTPITNVALTGKVENNNHDLNWNIISDEAVKSIELESSIDGSRFMKLTNFNSDIKSFAYNPSINGEIFYRLKVTSVTDQTVYSNVITLKSLAELVKSFTVSTLVHDEVIVNAKENYQYIIADINGRIIAKGNNNAGIKRININNHPSGMYIMQIISPTQRITEKIIRQ
jgi:hypothetical protein